MESKQEDQKLPQQAVAEIQRALARIARIRNLQPVPNADRLLTGSAFGWEYVIVDNQISEGELGVFFEPDSKMPTGVSWLSEKLQGSVIKTVKLRGSVSQGLFVECKEFDEPLYSQLFSSTKEGDDVTSLLGITKRPDELPDLDDSGYAKYCYNVYNPPPKTDEPRVQNVGRLLKEKLHGLPFRATLKIDGTSVTYGLSQNKPHDLVISSRNLLVSDPDSVYAQVAQKHKIHQKLLRMNKLEESTDATTKEQQQHQQQPDTYPRYVIQGEIYGPSIHKNLLNVKQFCFAAFSVWDSIQSQYLQVDKQDKLLTEQDIPQAPVATYIDDIDNNEKPLIGDAFDANNMTTKQLLHYARGNYPGTQNAREGFVLRSCVGVPRARISFKVINNEYLLKKDARQATDKPRNDKNKKQKEQSSPTQKHEIIES